MPYDNSLNTAKGRSFQEQVHKALARYYNIEFLIDHPIPIGNPPKEHKFDLVSKNSKYIAECKNYSWTETGNIPDAKMAKCDQALLYLFYSPKTANKLLILKKDTHPSKPETLAQYYKRTHQHLLGEVSVMEFDRNSSELTEL